MSPIISVQFIWRTRRTSVFVSYGQGYGGAGAAADASVAGVTVGAPRGGAPGFFSGRPVDLPRVAAPALASSRSTRSLGLFSPAACAGSSASALSRRNRRIFSLVSRLAMGVSSRLKMSSCVSQSCTVPHRIRAPEINPTM